MYQIRWKFSLLFCWDDLWYLSRMSLIFTKHWRFFSPQYFLENRIDSRLQVIPTPVSCLHFKCLLELERETECRPIGRGLCQFSALPVSVFLGEEGLWEWGCCTFCAVCTGQMRKHSFHLHLICSGQSLGSHTIQHLICFLRDAEPSQKSWRLVAVSRPSQTFPDYCTFKIKHRQGWSVPFQALFLCSIGVHPLLDLSTFCPLCLGCACVSFFFRNLGSSSARSLFSSTP